MKSRYLIISALLLHSNGYCADMPIELGIMSWTLFAGFILVSSLAVGIIPVYLVHRHYRNKKIFWLTPVVGFVLVNIIFWPFGGRDYTALKLASGKEIKMIGVSKVHFAGSDPVLVFKYEIDSPVSGKDSLLDEVGEIWGIFKYSAEKSGLKMAVIQAKQTTRKNFMQYTSKNYNFIFDRDESGYWKMRESKK